MAAGIGTLFVVSILVFAAPRCSRATPRAPCSERPRRRRRSRKCASSMGLDKPAVERYADWLGGLAHGDLGNSAAGYAAGGKMPIWESDQRQDRELADPRGHHRAPDDPAVAAARRPRGAPRRPAGRPRHLATSLAIVCAAGVRDRLAADPRLLLLARRAAARSSLLAPGESPLANPRRSCCPCSRCSARRSPARRAWSRAG